MPASRSVVMLTVILVLAGLGTVRTNFTGVEKASYVTLSHPATSSLDAALQWLASNQSSDGSYGAYEEHWAAAAAYALWLNDTSSRNAALSYSWLGSQVNSSLAWFWGTEADVPGAVLFSIASSGNLRLVNTSFVTASLLQLQQTHSGFAGYYDLVSGQIVASSVDTDTALLGLISAAAIPKTNETDATAYLLNLQNHDGSFNLTRSIASDPIDALGPDPVSITALTILALKYAGLTLTNSSIVNGLAFLNKASSEGFDGHLYAAAISDLAFKAYGQVDAAVSSTLFILSQQNCDGGFSDISRLSSYPHSNAYDTGWAASALETQFSGQSGSALANSQRLNCAPIASFLFNPSPPSAGAAVLFNASASTDPDNDPLSYNWTFGDGHSAEGVSVTHIFAKAGNFTVTLTVTDSGTYPGPLSNTASQTISVQEASVQKSPGLSLNLTPVLFIASVVGAVGLVALVALAFYLGRRSGRRLGVTSISAERFPPKNWGAGLVYL